MISWKIGLIRVETQEEIILVRRVRQFAVYFSDGICRWYRTTFEDLLHHDSNHKPVNMFTWTSGQAEIRSRVDQHHKPLGMIRASGDRAASSSLRALEKVIDTFWTDLKEQVLSLGSTVCGKGLCMYVWSKPMSSAVVYRNGCWCRKSILVCTASASMVRVSMGGTWIVLTSICLPSPASAGTFQLSKLQLLDFGDCMTKSLDFITTMRALNAKAACHADRTRLSHLSGVLVHVERCHPHRVWLKLLLRWKSRGINPWPLFKFDFWIFIDLLTFLSSWAALCLNWKCCGAKFHADASEKMLMLKMSVVLRLVLEGCLFLFGHGSILGELSFNAA